MDQSFLLRARRMLEERRATVDHGTLVKTILDRQSASPTARAAAIVNEAVANGEDEECVIALLLGEANWRAAARRQGGCFNRAATKRHLNSL